MRVLVLVYFWIMIFLTFLRIMEMALRDWPVKREPKTLGLAAAETLCGIGFLVWAGIVLWM